MTLPCPKCAKPLPAPEPDARGSILVRRCPCGAVCRENGSLWVMGRPFVNVPVGGAVAAIVSGPPVLGIDPGVHMGLSLVQTRRVLFSEQLLWPTAGKATAADLERVVRKAVEAGCRVAVVEVLGQVGGDAKGRYTSWATMSRTAGRAIQECERQGLKVVELDSGAWRKRLGLPASFGEDAEKDANARKYAQALLGLDGVSPHQCEAALMAAGEGT